MHLTSFIVQVHLHLLLLSSGDSSGAFPDHWFYHKRSQIGRRFFDKQKCDVRSKRSLNFFTKKTLETISFFRFWSQPSVFSQRISYSFFATCHLSNDLPKPDKIKTDSRHKLFLDLGFLEAFPSSPITFKVFPFTRYSFSFSHASDSDHSVPEFSFHCIRHVWFWKLGFAFWLFIICHIGFIYIILLRDGYIVID